MTNKIRIEHILKKRWGWGEEAASAAICPMPWLSFLPPGSLLQPVLAALRVALGRESSCVKVSGLRHAETQLRGAVFSTATPFCSRSRVCAREGPTASSQALPVSVAYVLSLVSRALQEQNPEYAHPFPAHKGPAINFVLETPTTAPVTLSPTLPPPSNPQGKPRGSIL